MTNTAGEIKWTDDNGKKHWADFREAAANSWGAQNGFPYEILFNSTQEMRFAKILATVVYVAVDEDENGKPVVEKWKATSKFWA